MDVLEKSLLLHKQNKGKIGTCVKVDITNREELSLAYTPGVSAACKKIAENKMDVYTYTFKANSVAVVTDGSAVLGLGNIGPEAALPVMEGKCALFKRFGDVDAIPICLNTQDTEEIVSIIKSISPTFGGINIEDISAPRCFEIMERLAEELTIPVFHDDQEGSSIVVLGALVNALKIVGKNKEDIRVVVNGAGAAGTAVARLLLKYGVGDVIVCDSQGIISLHREDIDGYKKEMASMSNKADVKGTLQDALVGADVFIGVSVGNVVTPTMVQSMNKDAIVFAMANPIPEIFPQEAKNAGARIVGSGRADFNNQINNSLVFPNLFHAILQFRISKITDEMKIAIAHALANVVSPDVLDEEYIVPSPFDPHIREAFLEVLQPFKK